MLHPARCALAAQGPATLGMSPASSQPRHIIRMTASKLEISTCSRARRDTASGVRVVATCRSNIKRRPDHVVQGRGHPSSAGSSCLGTHPDEAGRLGARPHRRGAEPHRPGPGRCGPGGGRRAASNHQACLTVAGMAVGAAGRGGLADPARAAGMAQPCAARAAGQPRRVRLPDCGAGGSSPPAGPSAGSPGGRPESACSGSARLGPDRWPTR
jgi:hypothetical protein